MTGRSVALRLFNSTGVVALAGGLFWMPLQDGRVDAGLNAPPQERFEVASIKPTGESDAGFTFVSFPPGGRFKALNASLRDLLVSAYGDSREPGKLPIVGGPEWMDSAGFNVDAIGGPDGPSPGMTRRLQTLLMDRFGLAVHRERRPLPVYALVVEAEGKLEESDVSCPPPAPIPRSPLTDGLPCGLRTGSGRLSADAITLTKLVEFLSRMPDLDRLVVDRTGLTGRFRVDLHWTPTLASLPGGAPSLAPLRKAPPPPARNEVAPDAAPGFPTVSVREPSLADAVQEQLGLKLVETTAPVDVLVIDRVHKPGPN